ncbi:MAG: thioredoxin [Alphaproteobacteria bacterium]
MSEQIIGGAMAGAGGWVKDTDTANFAVDVLDASMEAPVLVDFWAPWCGPCKQLGPIIEKVVNGLGGAVRLVKLNIDDNPQIAQQMRVQSIPAVFAFAGGRPVDGFVGALPESQIKAFVDRVIRAAGSITGPSPIDDALAQAKEALDAGDAATAGSIYGQVLQHAPDNMKAMAGLARCYVATGQTDAAKQLLDHLPEKTRMEADFQAVLSAIALAEEAQAAAGKLPELQRRVAADPADIEARYELAVARFAQGEAEAAIDDLLAIVKKNRAWNEDGARKQLVKLFDALGSDHPLTVAGRQRLSAILFA